MAKVVIHTNDIGKIAMALFFFLFGIMFLFPDIQSRGTLIILALCALIAGVLQLVELK